MDEVKRKVYLDLFASPYSLIPLAGGLTSLMASWAMSGQPTLTMAGILGVLGGLGVTATRLIFGLEGLTEQAYDYQLDKKQKEKEAQLDRLDALLEGDRDPRTESCLRELRLLYASLQKAAEKGNINASSYEILEGVGKVFDETVKQLEHSHSLWETARRMRGPARESILQQRDEVIRDVCVTVSEVGQMVDKYLLTKTKQKRSELNKLRRELDESIEAARRAEARTAALDKSARSEVME